MKQRLEPIWAPTYLVYFWPYFHPSPLPISVQMYNFDAPRRLPQQSNPSAVRAYIRHILISRRDATPQFAEAAAVRWHLGRADDLYGASAKSLAKVFGPEVGPIVFSSVRDDIWTDWSNSYQGLVGTGIVVLIVEFVYGQIADLVSHRLFGAISVTRNLFPDSCM